MKYNFKMVIINMCALKFSILFKFIDKFIKKTYIKR